MVSCPGCCSCRGRRRGAASDLRAPWTLMLCGQEMTAVCVFPCWSRERRVTRVLELPCSTLNTGEDRTYKILQIVIARRLRGKPLKFCYASCSGIYLSCISCRGGLFQHLLSDVKMSFPFFGTKLILVKC